MPSTSDIINYDAGSCSAAHLDEFVIELPTIPTDSNDQSVVEYLINLPDDNTASPVVQCFVDGTALPLPLQQPPAIILPDEIRPYPAAERCTAVKRKSKAKSATLITGSPFKNKLSEDQKVHQGRKRKSGVKDAAKKQIGPNRGSYQKRRKINQKVKNLQAGGSLIREDNDACGNCGFTYGEPNDPLIDDEWCRCIGCTKWCHISCGETRRKAFSCFKCF